jgi:hypothetical protein
MAKSILTHEDDGGVLSIVTSGNTVVLACEHGHYWVLDAQQQSSESVKDALENVLPADKAQALYKAL